MEESYEQHLLRQREEKDEFFANDPHSPIAPDQRKENFPGLQYFPPDFEYRFVLPLHKHEERTEIVVETTTEGEQSYLRWGEFRLEIDDHSITLQAYKSDPDASHLWVPFRDETNGEQTYGAGRYLDLSYEDDQHPSGEWVLDFNRAYNPTCAYNEAYECPLIPMENWLDVAISAGEQTYPLDPVSVEHHH